MTVVDAEVDLAQRREQVITRLRSIVDMIESGDLPADSYVVAIGSGDLGYAHWTGARSWEHLRDLVGLIDDKISRKRWGKDEHEDDLTPAQRRKRIAAAQARREREHEQAHPWLCTCGDRFKGERGARQHQRIQQRQSGQPQQHGSVKFSPPPELVPTLEVVS